MPETSATSHFLLIKASQSKVELTWNHVLSFSVVFGLGDGAADALTRMANKRLPLLIHLC